MITVKILDIDAEYVSDSECAQKCSMLVSFLFVCLFVCFLICNTSLHKLKNIYIKKNKKRKLLRLNLMGIIICIEW